MICNTMLDLVSWVLYLSSVSAAGGGSLRPAGSGHVSVEPAGPASPLHVFLAGAVRSADLLLLQHQG